jgi:hypothetical protein
MNTRTILYGAAAAMAAALVLAPTPAAAQGGPPPGFDKMVAAAAAKPTPQLAGHPDLTGFWGVPGALSKDDINDGNTTYLFGKNGGDPRGSGGTPHRPDPNPPPYKPELLAKVKDLEDHSTRKDPAYFCKPQGIPRAGPPKQIVATPNLVIFLYQIDGGPGDTPGNAVRLIPTDGREHRKDIDPLYFGDSVGHWEGDTLVVDVTKFTDDTWMAGRGYFHSRKMHVVERLTRKGDTLRYEVTVEDPTVLTGPWVLTPRTLLNSDGMVVEAPPCIEYDESHLVNDNHL